MSDQFVDNTVTGFVQDVAYWSNYYRNNLPISFFVYRDSNGVIGIDYLGINEYEDFGVRCVR